MKRQFQVMVLASAATLVLVGAPVRSLAQDTTIDEEGRRAQRSLRAIRELEGFLAEAEAARLAGRCDRVRAWHSFFHGTNPSFTISDSVPAELREIFRRRIDEIAAQDCPPGSGTPSVSMPPVQTATEPVPATPPTAPPNQSESILDEAADDINSTAPDASPPPASSPDASDPSFIRGQMSVALQACNRARFEELKRRLIASLDRRISEAANELAADEFTRGRLMRERELAQAAAMPDPCPPVSPASSPQAPAAVPDAPALVGSVGSPAPESAPRAPAPLRTDRSSLIGARGALRAAAGRCDPLAYGAAKQRLLGLLGQLIAEEADPGRREALERERDAVRDSDVPICGEDGDDLGVNLGAGAGNMLGNLFSIGAFAGQFGGPQTGIGFQREGAPGIAPEVDAVLTEEWIDFLNLGGFFYIPGTDTALRIGGHYSEGSAANRFDIRGNAGAVTGVVYGDNAPSGSSGIATPFGLTGGTRAEYQSYGTVFDLGLYGGGAHNAGWFGTGAGSEGSDGGGPGVSLWAAYDHMERDYELTAFSSGSSGGFVFEFSQDRQQELGENYFGTGLAGNLAVPLGGGLTGHLGGRAGGYYRDSNLRSVERNISNFGPASDRDFTIEIRDSDDGWGVRGEAGAALEFRLSPRLSLTLGGAVDYWSDVGAIFNPNSGDQVFFEGLTTELRTQDAWSWRAGAGLTLRFGGD